MLACGKTYHIVCILDHLHNYLSLFMNTDTYLLRQKLSTSQTFVYVLPRVDITEVIICMLRNINNMTIAYGTYEIESI